MIDYERLTRQLANEILKAVKAGKDYPPEVITMALYLTGDLS